MVDQFIGFLRGTDPTAYRYLSLALPEWLAERVGGWRDAGTDISLSMPDDAAMSVNADAVALGRLLRQPGRQRPAPRRRAHRGGVAARRRRRPCWTWPTTAPASLPSAARRPCGPFARLDDARTRTGNVGLGSDRWPRPSPARTAAHWNYRRRRRRPAGARHPAAGGLRRCGSRARGIRPRLRNSRPVGQHVEHQHHRHADHGPRQHQPRSTPPPSSCPRSSAARPGSGGEEAVRQPHEHQHVQQHAQRTQPAEAVRSCLGSSDSVTSMPTKHSNITVQSAAVAPRWRVVAPLREHPRVRRAPASRRRPPCPPPSSAPYGCAHDTARRCRSPSSRITSQHAPSSA